MEHNCLKKKKKKQVNWQLLKVATGQCEFLAELTPCWWDVAHNIILWSESTVLLLHVHSLTITLFPPAWTCTMKTMTQVEEYCCWLTVRVIMSAVMVPSSYLHFSEQGGPVGWPVPSVSRRQSMSALWYGSLNSPKLGWRWFFPWEIVKVSNVYSGWMASSN